MIRHRIKKRHDGSWITEKMNVILKPFEKEPQTEPIQVNTNGNNKDPLQPGRFVNARLSGYPSWPAIIDSHPITGKFYDASTNRYRVMFFDGGKTSLSWLTAKQIKPFCKKELLRNYGRMMKSKTMTQSAKSLKKRLIDGIIWAEYVRDDIPEEERYEYLHENMKEGEENDDENEKGDDD